ncbi:MAG: cyclic nucleotide-binding domain-containing protein [Lachnospiraceae bacterium]|nr:cyclic nucleotide-binding domain-containing protein [Lachnospiraceae bacterium]
MDKGKLVRFPAESVILEEGKVNKEMYKIISGNAEMYTGYGTPLESFLGILGKQSFFGEFGLLLGKPSIYTVIAYSEVTALKITENELSAFIVENHKNIVDIMRNMAGSMLTLKTQIDMLLKELQSSGKADDEKIRERMAQARQIMKNYALQTYVHSTDVYDRKG